MVRFKIQALICPLSFWLFKLQRSSIHEVLCMLINVTRPKTKLFIYFISDGRASVIVGTGTWPGGEETWSPGKK
jgi:hypothetical protein